MTNNRNIEFAKASIEDRAGILGYVGTVWTHINPWSWDRFGQCFSIIGIICSFIKIRQDSLPKLKVFSKVSTMAAWMIESKEDPTDLTVWPLSYIHKRLFTEYRKNLEYSKHSAKKCQLIGMAVIGTRKSQLPMAPWSKKIGSNESTPGSRKEKNMWRYTSLMSSG